MPEAHVQGNCLGVDGPAAAGHGSDPQRPSMPEGHGDHADLPGRRIRQLRQARGLSLRQFAASVGLSAAMISQVERGINDPSLDTVRRIAGYLGVPVFDLFQGYAAASVVVQRSSDVITVSAAHTHWTVRQIGPGNPAIELLEGILEPGTASTAEPHSHPASEVVHVVEGSVDVEVGGVVHRLELGDSCSFDSRTPHRYLNPTGARARLLLAVTPPSF